MRLGRCQFAQHSLYLDILNSLSTVFAVQEAQISLLCLSLVTVFTMIFIAIVVNMVPVISSFPIGYDACRLDRDFSAARTCPVRTFVTLLLLI